MRSGRLDSFPQNSRWEVERPSTDLAIGAASNRRRRIQRPEAVRDIECFNPRLNSLSLLDLEISGDGRVPLPERRTDDVVPAMIGRQRSRRRCAELRHDLFHSGNGIGDGAAKILRAWTTGLAGTINILTESEPRSGQCSVRCFHQSAPHRHRLQRTNNCRCGIDRYSRRSSRSAQFA